jgi:hypothetical protein
MSIFKEITANDIKTSRSSLNQLIDVVQEDVSGSATRRRYQVYVTGGIGPGVTSSLFQTVYDQDFTLQTANAIFDMTVGLFYSGSTVTDSSTGVDSTGKILFPSQTLMMREKVDVYKQYAQVLLGDANKAFYAPFSEVQASAAGTTTANRINEALFISFKRLFSRDQIKRETFALRMYQSASDGSTAANLAVTSTRGANIFTDFGSSVNQRTTFGSEVGDIVNSSNTDIKVGNVFYDAGVIVLDLAKVISGSEHATGTISAMATATTINGAAIPAGYTVLGSSAGNAQAKFIPDFLVSASIDNIVDHFASTRFQSGTLTAMTMQNNTFINSTLVFCRATADEFNYSSNPTFKDTSDRIRVIDEGQEGVQRTFTMPTTVGLYDANSNLLAVAKMSRPVEKNDEKDLTIRIRLDF